MACAGAVHEGGGEDGSVGEGERPTGGAEYCSAGAGATDPRDGAAQRPGAGQNHRHQPTSCVSIQSCEIQLRKKTVISSENCEQS